MYTCGPTVYDYAHIGNFRAYMFEDILRRQLKFEGFEVKQVMNLTDVDDKTIRGAIADGISLDAYTKPFKDAFFDDLRALNIEEAEVYPAATDHVDQMIRMIKQLIASGHAYVSDDGSVYYQISKFDDYGRLAKLDREGLQAGARVSHDEYDKENVGDFALWKSWGEEDGEVAWDSPWGRGRPGWHIECSAMSMHYLGESFDLHTGGVDNIFPHHENEIAQSEAATGTHPFVKYWMHCGYLNVGGAKMSKSEGNYYTLRNLLDKGYDGRQVRYVLMAAQYRQPLNFTFDALDAARAALGRIDEFHERLLEAAGEASEAGQAPAWAKIGVERFRDAMNDDLNMPEALGALFNMIHEGNRAMDENSFSAEAARSALAEFVSLDQVLGILSTSQGDEAGADVVALMEARTRARENKDWAESDRIRDELAAVDWEVRDTPQGPKLKKLRT
jgi:cysteinyl-tRNA synthetase